MGDSEGNTFVFNTLNGALLKKLPKHGAEVVRILHIMYGLETDKDKINYIVTASADNVIIISDDEKINEADEIRYLLVTFLEI